jgi:hypothetical protein
MYTIEIQPDKKRIGITMRNGGGMEMTPDEIRKIVDAYEKEDWDGVIQACENAMWM